MEARDRIRKFILEEVCPDANLAHIEDDAPLVTSGLVDSLGILRILSFLDDEFGVNIASEEIKQENFSTIATIVALLDNTHILP
ncbi:MAG: acyl carrier protein [Gammaproteobacteria bacterium]